MSPSSCLTQCQTEKKSFRQLQVEVEEIENVFFTKFVYFFIFFHKSGYTNKLC